MKGIKPVLMGMIMVLVATAVKADCYCGCKGAIHEVGGKILEGIAKQTENLASSLTGVKGAVEGMTQSEKLLEDHLAKSIAAALQNIEDAKNTVASQRRMMSQAYNHCSGRDVASAASSGSAAAGKTREESNALFAEQGEGTKESERTAREDIRKAAEEGPLSEKEPFGHDFFPKEGLLDSEDTAKAEDAIRLMVDPYPNPKIEDDGSVAAAEAKVEQMVKKSRLAIPLDTLHAVKADVDAVLPAQLLEEYVKTAKADHIKVPKDKNGMTSMAAFYDILGSKARLLNPQWHQYLIEDAVDEIGVLREMAMMQAIQLSVEVDTRNWLKRIAALLAQIVASDAEKSNAKIQNFLYGPGVAPVSAE